MEIERYLNTFNVRFKPDDRIGLIGVNGTGKSSFLKAIAHVEPADQGEAKDYQIEYLAQEPYFHHQLTVFEQIYYGDSQIMTVLRHYEKARLQLAENLASEQAQAELLRMQEAMDAHDAWDASSVAKTS